MKISEANMCICHSVFRLTFLIFSFSVSTFGTQLFAQGLTTDEISDAIAQLAETTDSYQADFTVITEKKGVSKTAIGHIKYKWPNKSWREIRRQGDGALMGLVISNGKIKWNYIPIGNLALKYDLEALDEDAQQKGWGSAADLDEASLEYVGQEQLDGEKVYVLEGIPSDLLKQKNPEQPGKVRVFIGVKDGIIRKMITYNVHGEEIASQIYRNIQQDLSISNKDFEFIPPAGTKILEMKDIGSIINSLQ